MSLDKQYLGDGVYVAVSGYDLVLTTENGISITNEIVLEPEVLRALLKYLERLSVAVRGAKP
jgi:hypothetical protein